MKGDDDVLTLQIRGEGPIGGLTVTADSRWKCKRLCRSIHRSCFRQIWQGKLDVGGAVGIWYSAECDPEDLGMKEPYVGQTELQTGEIAEDLTYYFAASEQVPSSRGTGGSDEERQYGKTGWRIYYSADAF